MPDKERLEKELKDQKQQDQHVQQKLLQKRKEAKRLKIEKQMRCEWRILVSIFVVGLFGTLTFIIAFSTEYWVWVDLKEPQKKNDYERGQGYYLKTGHYHGLWRFCRREIWAGQNETVFCRKMSFDVLPNVTPQRLVVETKMADFRRSTVAVGIIAIVLSSLAHAFTWYSLNQYRYMFKRLAGCLHLITGASCWVVSEVFRQAMMFEKSAMEKHVKEFSKIRLGWSYYLVWVSLFSFLIPGGLMLYYSRKRKGACALNVLEALENEPVNLSRV